MWHIEQAEKHHLREILEINLVIDYENPDDFVEYCLEKGYVAVYIEDDTVKAFSLYQLIWGNTLMLTLVKVLPECQGNWIGTSLIADFEEKMVQIWYKKYLSSTEKTNVLSQKFHSKLGFKEIGLLSMPHGEEIFYEKKL